MVSARCKEPHCHLLAKQEGGPGMLWDVLEIPGACLLGWYPEPWRSTGCCGKALSIPFGFPCLFSSSLVEKSASSTIPPGIREHDGGKSQTHLFPTRFTTERNTRSEHPGHSRMLHHESFYVNNQDVFYTRDDAG